MLVALHAGLFQSLQSEPNLGILTSSMRALAILLCAAPYERLPQTLIPQVRPVVALSHAAENMAFAADCACLAIQTKVSDTSCGALGCY